MLLVLLASCGGQPNYNQPGPDRGRLLREGPPLAMAEVLVLEQAGISPTDTTVTFPVQTGRTIVMRHAQPDNAVFAVITVPADTTARGETRLNLTQLPGRYGLTITATPAWPEQVTLTYSYAIHFQAPAGSNAHYLSNSFYEATLGIGRIQPDQRLDFIPTSRPAADELQALITEPGTYVAAAPR